MKRKLQNIIYNLASLWAILGILILWQIVTGLELVPAFLLPAPKQVILAFIQDFWLLMEHIKVTLTEAIMGLACGILLGFSVAVFMDHCKMAYRALYPVMVLTQTIPTIAIAPLLVLWMGYEMAPKIVLITVTTFFPIAVGLLEGFQTADEDIIRLLRAMGAGRRQIFFHVKFPTALGSFFSGIRIAVSYSIVGAVISEWLGGYQGLGVYMTRVRKSYAFDKMFAVIFLISGLSLGFMALVSVLQKKCMPWEQMRQERKLDETK